MLKFMGSFNFKARFVDEKQVFGRYINGSWNGLILSVWNQVNPPPFSLSQVSIECLFQTVDMGLCELLFTNSRNAAVNYLHFTIMERLHFMSLSPDISANPLMALLPFTRAVWSMIVSTLIGLSIVVNWQMALMKWAKFVRIQPSPSATMMHVYAILMNQSKLFWN